MAQLNSPTNQQGTNYKNECFAMVSVPLPDFPLVQFFRGTQRYFAGSSALWPCWFLIRNQGGLFRLHPLSVFDII